MWLQNPKIRTAETSVFPVVTYGRESWTMRKKERKTMVDAFELWVWRTILRVLRTEKKSEILQKVRPNISLEALTKMLKMWYFGHMMSHQSLEKDIMLGIIWVATLASFYNANSLFNIFNVLPKISTENIVFIFIVFYVSVLSKSSARQFSTWLNVFCIYIFVLTW